MRVNAIIYRKDSVAKKSLDDDQVSLKVKTKKKEFETGTESKYSSDGSWLKLDSSFFDLLVRHCSNVDDMMSSSNRFVDNAMISGIDKRLKVINKIGRFTLNHKEKVQHRKWKIVETEIFLCS